MTKYHVWVPVLLDGMVREHKTDVAYEGEIDRKAIEEMRRVAVEHVAGKKLEVVEGREIRITRPKQ
ncbi:hypothetical protein ACIHFE_18155 [Streptomyces sp. NPDC052396]|uniref:hypothetical protein n=1 Tax=Streptomyces sp. NPDC052396 TaxID=3365689 RepID=UPI0037D65066